MNFKNKINYFWFILLVGILSVMVISCNKKDSSASNGQQPGENSQETGGDCFKSTDCVEQCDEIFESKLEKESCEQLFVNEVKGIFLAFDKDGYLEDPSQKNLDQVLSINIKNALKIDENLWSDFIKEYTFAEAKRVLYWITTKEGVYDAISSSLEDDRNLEIFFKIFFKAIDVSTFTDFITRILDKDAEDNFIILALKKNNHSAASFIIKRAEEDCPISDYTSVIDLSREACLLGQVFCRTNGNKYVFKQAFEFVVNESGDLKDFVEGGGSGDEDFTDGLGVKQKDSNDVAKVCEAAKAQGLPGV